MNERTSPAPVGVAVPRWVRESSWRRLAVFLFFSLVALVVNPGVPGSVDTYRRMQVTRSLWTVEPEVASSDPYGIPGTAGVLRAYYGLGQSLVLLPADMVSAVLEMAVSPAHRSRVRGFLAMLLGAVPVAGLTGYLAFRLGCLAGLEKVRAFSLSATWFLGSTVLPHVQIWQESSLLISLMLAQLVAMEELRISGSPRRTALWAIFGGAAGALAILTKLPSLGFSILIFGLVLAWNYKGGIRFGREGLWAVGLAVGLAGDRLYHFLRFGSWLGTYIHEWGEWAKRSNPTLPEFFPFSTPLSEGISGMLFIPAFSFLLVEPMLLLVLFALVVRRSRPARVGLLMLVGVLDVVIQAAFYGRFYNWMGWDGWGNRFLAPSCQVACLGALLFVVPVLAGGALRVFRILTLFCALFQALACCLWYQLEVQQVYYLGTGFPQIGLRLVNAFVLAFRPGELSAVVVPGVSERMLVLNLFPFLAGRTFPGVSLWSFFFLVALVAMSVALGVALTRGSREPGVARPAAEEIE